MESFEKQPVFLLVLCTRINAAKIPPRTANAKDHFRERRIGDSIAVKLM